MCLYFETIKIKKHYIMDDKLPVHIELLLQNIARA